ncbi:glycosyl transferase family 2 [Bacillus canaveralius]|uniref:Glycosyl transferase family 2 n=1 Tax=Bacillus canaveralius TaxID=1403243 RepID=A0A2N5GMK2_9BACI|nr:glycosyltransferase [Bacillus canaveralius]PLR83165.1 glycosyl transferase family 2 [Bacillus canaveralius]PLR94083.1 glycosyl transferase family 2 [Bacillus canaveralius]
MNNNKVCFIYCVNNQSLLEESLKYIYSLDIPEGFEIDVITIEDSPAMAAGYNRAMQDSDAKYKVYLHQDVIIVNQNLITDIIKLFTANPKLGMLGVAGSKYIPGNGIWWESKFTYGKVYDSHSGNMELLQFNEVTKDYQSVHALDGLILITQFDIPWREDLFGGWHFYDLSQCMEFIKQGYEVGIPPQDRPWCLHDCGIVNTENGFDLYANIYLNEYKNEIKETYPLVSILIPTYNRPEFFEQAIISAIKQSYLNIEIIVCDDSTNDDTKEIVDRYVKEYEHITYIKNQQNLGQFENDLKLMSLAKGEYINFLMDDDLFHPEKIKKMMRYFLQDSEVNIVTSHRQIINENGKFANDIKSTQRLFKEDQILDGLEFGSFILKELSNFIGEPTTVLFKKSKLLEPFGTYGGRRYLCNVDLASWFNLLETGKVVYINETLSYFRIHSGQQQQNFDMYINGLLDYIHQILIAKERGFLKTDEDYSLSLEKCINYADNIMTDQIITEYTGDRLPEVQSYLDYMKLQFKELKQKKKKESPLVSILIPAYNRPELLEIALKSVLDQTYPNIEIIISDDSTNDEVKDMLAPYLQRHNHIKYKKNEIPMVEKNFSQCVKMASGEFINYLMDDDVFHPKKIEIMAQYLIENQNISLVTSHRQLIDEQGHFLPDKTETKVLFKNTTILPGRTLGDFCLKNMCNFIGEPTTVLFRRKDIANDFGIFENKQYSVINDLATWISLLAKGDAVYIPESLSYFRQHSGQNQESMRFLKDAIPQWLSLLIDSRKSGFLNNEIEYKKSLVKYIDIIKHVISHGHRQQKLELLDTEDINASLSLFLKELTCNDSHFCPYCKQRFQSFIPWSDDYDFENYDWEMWNKRTAICPNCHSLDRERLYKIFIEKETNINSKDLAVLHIAPEKNLRDWLSAKPNLAYVAGDLFPSDKDMIKLDITDIGYNNQHFDVVLCSHVLEHVPDDMKGLKELYRVLKTGGWGIIQVPIALNINMTLEDPTITTPEDRKRIFGQDDHVRIYSKSDFVNRLKLVGFRVEEYKPIECFGIDITSAIGLSEKDTLYIVYKA